ncbi:hypothetical protein IQ06DRAFT_332906 [Phaeosphaeriaceae sp. SRC1lsM3a]|nr:hypothetical protein IQ06DRAFT_332906 [Stagonospora sp. SRC1lsM3a]
MAGKETHLLTQPINTGEKPTKASHAFTYRLSRIPAFFTISQVRSLFSEADQGNFVGSISLADSVYATEANEKVATVTFSEEPNFAADLKSCGPDCTLPLVTSAYSADDGVQLDNHFQGLTPLNNPGSSEIAVDIVACSGLAASAFGGWQHANGKMWLRDFLPIDIPRSRVFIWGKRSELHRSLSHIDILHYRDSLLDDLWKIRKSPTELSRPLILVGHSLGGILIKAAFVKASYDKSFSVLRDTIGGMVFFGTPHEGIENSDWIDIWGSEPPGTLIRDLAPGSSLLRQLRDGFQQNLRQEHILTVFELQETNTIQRIEFGKLDRKGKPILRLDEKAACLHCENEMRVPINENHSKIARLLNDEGSPYHTIKEHLQNMVRQAGSLVSIRVQKRSILASLLGLRAYFQHLHKAATQPFVLLVVEDGDIEAVCHAISQYDHVLPDPPSQVASLLSLSSSTTRLRDLFKGSIIEASFRDGNLKSVLKLVDGDFWGPSIHSQYQALPTTPMGIEDIIKAAIPLIVEIKESLGAAMLSQEPSLLRAFIEGDQAKQLGLDLVVQRRELLNQSDIPLAQPSTGQLGSISDHNGLCIGTFLTADRLDSHKVIVEDRSYGKSGSDQAMKEERKRASQELATILRDASFRPREETYRSNSAKEDNALRRLLHPTMSIFQFEGYIDDIESERLRFMYRLPTQLGISPDDMIYRTRSFAHWIEDTGEGPPRLEERTSADGYTKAYGPIMSS